MDELTEALELATDEELHYCADILFRRKFNPLDYVATPKVNELKSRDRLDLIEAIAKRFKFLAADGLTVLKGKTNQVSYRQVLEMVCQHLAVTYSKSQTVAEIEAELFLGLIQKSWQKLSPRERKRLNDSMQLALTESDLQKSLPKHLHNDPLGLVLKGSGAIALSTVIQPAVMSFLARQFAIHLATYQVGQEAIKLGGTAIANKLQVYISTNIAKYGMASTAAKYAVARTAFSFITPALWGVFFADLGWRAIATNYARIIPVIFTLAQIRLLRDI
ncbi:YaaW family protein [Synechococcus sp. PCC 7502]|uniref:YaaW family protein n=1 Tax=Synechococcus sp. PCC 7502 TaxID=1173263 RepID=UPI00059E67ED|nr:YaaW family protein [Synechococcus sp. PCC 7502]